MQKRDTHDGAGNLIREDANGVVTQYAYDPSNRQTKVTHPDGTLSTYTYQGYDGLRRTRQEPGGSVHTQVWDGSDYLGEY
jgi:YD repeat-containing protein